MNDKDKVTLVYDKQCPVCEFYCQRVEIEEESGSLELIDARHESDIMQDISNAGLDIDQGMVLKKDGVMHYGSDAINELGKIGRRKGWFNRLNRFFFQSRLLSHIMYPVFKFFRNILLKIMGKTKINNLKVKGKTHF